MLFREKEELRSQLETTLELKAKLIKVIQLSLPRPSLSPPLPPTNPPLLTIMLSSLSSQENQDIVKENAQLSGHRNTKQRIQFHAKLKMDYHKLLEVRWLV